MSGEPADEVLLNVIGLAVLAGVIVWVAVVSAWPCRFGFHNWDRPGGNCEDCGIRDDFREPEE